MTALIEITGGRPLLGELTVQGSKNAMLPLLAATLLHRGISRFHGCPNITDVTDTLHILEGLGCRYVFEKGCLTVDASVLTSVEVLDDSVKNTRSSVLILGALLSRMKEAVISYPGGCSIGSRKIDLHLEALRAMGAEVLDQGQYLVCHAARLCGTELTLRFPSVGATENLILAGICAEGTTLIRNAAREPEVCALCHFLNGAGARIAGIGTATLVITGVSELHDSEFTLPADRIVAGTYLAAAAGAGGSIFLRGAKQEELRSVTELLRQCGCTVTAYENGLSLKSVGRLRMPERLRTAPFPAFPTDLQSQFMAMLTIADGQTVIEEQIFESRFLIVPALRSMGADITVQNTTATVRGVKRLSGTALAATDLRGGAALVLAGLFAEGTTQVSRVSHIYRGYEDICRDLSALNGCIRSR